MKKSQLQQIIREEVKAVLKKKGGSLGLKEVDDSNDRVVYKDKNNPNFLYIDVKYPTGLGGALTALGRDTMSGSARKKGAERAFMIAKDTASELEKQYNIEDMEVKDLKNGKVQIFAVSDDFIIVNPKTDNKLKTIVNRFKPSSFREEVSTALSESKQSVRLDDLTFDKLRAIFPSKFQKKSTTRIVGGEKEDMYSDGINFPQLGNMVTVSSNSDLEEWKDYFKKRYGNVNIELDPNSTVWYQLVQINDPKFMKDEETHKAAVSSFMRESTVNEEESKLFAALEKSGKLTKPTGGASMNGKYYQLEGGSKYDMIHFDYDPKSNKPFGVVQVAGHHMPAQILRKLGFRETRSWTAGVEVYIFDGNYNPKYISEVEMVELVDNWSKGFGSYASNMAGFYKDRGRTSGTVDESKKKKKLHEFVDKAVGLEVVSMVYEIAFNHGYTGSCSKQYKTIAKQILDVLPQISKENRKAFIREIKNTERLMGVDEIIL